MKTIDEAIAHAREVAENKYKEGMLCHANPDDVLLDGCHFHKNIFQNKRNKKELKSDIV